ncbi:MAG TPA: serine/threonine-protein kinase [Kofleriaceae bacterium]|nr:serine/threonine-protein kinase [Kofleriaceae bacterium]
MVPNGPELALDRLGLRFSSRETEKQYRDWHARDALPFVRITYVASLVFAVPAALAAARFAAPDAFGPTVRWVMLLVAPILLAGTALTYRPSITRWLGLLSVVSNAVVSSTFVVVSMDVLHRPDVAMASTIIAGFLAFTVLRLHVGEALLAAVPYFAIDEILMMRSDQAHGDVVAYTCLNLIALTTGTIVAWTIGRTSRESYRQRRTIELQQHVIDRERERAAELRERELERVNEEVRRQVAERSRELSETLGRLSHAPLALQADRTIDGRYRIMRRLGVGGMGAVYEVERASDGRRLALKTLRGHGKPDTLARLAREAHVAAQLDHPNLVPVLDVGIADGVLFLVMPLVAGGSLEQQRPRFGDAAWVTPLLAPIAAGLAALHEHGIVHRDLKPANILLADGVPQIADFGLASLRIDPTSDTLASSAAHADTAAPLTRAGDLMGTPAYMAPELAAGAGSASTASDVFAFGVIAYELLRGRAPFAEPVVFARAEGRAVKPPAVDGIAESLARSLDLDPANRPSAVELAAALRDG